MIKKSFLFFGLSIVLGLILINLAINLPWSQKFIQNRFLKSYQMEVSWQKIAWIPFIKNTIWGLSAKGENSSCKYKIEAKRCDWRLNLSQIIQKSKRPSIQSLDQICRFFSKIYFNGHIFYQNVENPIVFQGMHLEAQYHSQKILFSQGNIQLTHPDWTYTCQLKGILNLDPKGVLDSDQWLKMDQGTLKMNALPLVGIQRIQNQFIYEKEGIRFLDGSGNFFGQKLNYQGFLNPFNLSQSELQLKAEIQLSQFNTLLMFSPFSGLKLNGKIQFQLEFKAKDFDFNQSKLELHQFKLEYSKKSTYLDIPFLKFEIGKSQWELMPSKIRFNDEEILVKAHGEIDRSQKRLPVFFSIENLHFFLNQHFLSADILKFEPDLNGILVQQIMGDVLIIPGKIEFNKINFSGPNIKGQITGSIDSNKSIEVAIQYQLLHPNQPMQTIYLTGNDKKINYQKQIPPNRLKELFM